MATHVLKIQGMTCDHCVRAVTASLKRLAGVSDANVDLESQTARVVHDEKRNNIGDLMAAVREAGYEVEGFQTDKPSGGEPSR